MTDEEIAKKHFLCWPYAADAINKNIAAALAAARAEEHAECVRLLLANGFAKSALVLESHKP